ncbi:MAG: metallophosphoesterase [Bifidobacteriaceae bacterium]|nr:metallophosphoesterase [Bifidobacteriaceae bacterium]
MNLRKAAFRVALIGAAAAGYAAAEAHWYKLDRRQLAILPPGSPPIRVLHISDPHFTARQRRKVAWVARLAELEPDLVVTTGDNFAFGDAMETALEAYEPLLAFPGAFVLGSNDYFSAECRNPLAYLWRSHTIVPSRQPDLPTDAFRQVLTGAGWLDLDNARGQLKLGTAGLPTDFVGLADPHAGWDRFPEDQGAGAASTFKLGLVHAPYTAAVQSLVDDGARLILAGHTHGGQVTVPGVGALVTNTDLPLALASGIHRWRGSEAYLAVSPGLGTSPFVPLRLGRRPAAGLITLTAQA